MNASRSVAAILTRIHRLHRHLRVLGGGAGAGEHSHEKLGGGRWEFAGHRGYVPGDDLRSVDWKASARSGRAYVRWFAAERLPRIRVLLDGSASMSIGSPAKLDRASEGAALAGGLVLLGGGEARLDGAGRAAGRVHRGPRQVEAWVHRCLGIPSSGGPLAALDLAGRGLRRDEAVLVLSDLLTLEDPLPRLARLAAASREVWVIHLLAEEDRAPQPMGWARLRDIESGEERLILADRERVTRVAAAVGAWCERLAAGASRHGFTYHGEGTARPLDRVVLRILSGAGAGSGWAG